MILLLDTCTFLWLTLNDPQLSPVAGRAIRDPANTPFLSVVSAWEICVKYDLGKLPLPTPPEQFVPAMRAGHGLVMMGVDEGDVLTLRQLPALHKDPFDRMLICQALARGTHLVTPDPLIRQYAVQALW